MKDLYGLTESDVKRLKQNKYIDENSIVYSDGKNSKGDNLYVVGFNTSNDRDIAYDFIFNNTLR